MISNQLYSGSLKTIVLKLLQEEGPMHGYALTRRVEEITAGRINLTFGALYPILHKLESEKAVVTTTEIHNNRTRIYYSLTKKGESLAVTKIRELKEFIESLQKIVEPQSGLNYA
jgi:DNA-binding PadR family transcriptional regulator